MHALCFRVRLSLRCGSLFSHIKAFGSGLRAGMHVNDAVVVLLGGDMCAQRTFTALSQYNSRHHTYAAGRAEYHLKWLPEGVSFLCSLNLSVFEYKAHWLWIRSTCLVIFKKKRHMQECFENIDHFKHFCFLDLRIQNYVITHPHAVPNPNTFFSKNWYTCTELQEFGYCSSFILLILSFLIFI